MGTSSFKHTEYRLPIVIQQFHSNLGDDLALLILFDLLQLISKFHGLIALLIRYTYMLGQIIVFDLEKQHAQKSSNSRPSPRNSFYTSFA